MLRKAALAVLAVSLFGLSARNTVKGVGRDIESVGEAGDLGDLETSAQVEVLCLGVAAARARRGAARG